MMYYLYMMTCWHIINKLRNNIITTIEDCIFAWVIYSCVVSHTSTWYMHIVHNIMCCVLHECIFVFIYL